MQVYNIIINLYKHDDINDFLSWIIPTIQHLNKINEILNFHDINDIKNLNASLKGDLNYVIYDMLISSKYNQIHLFLEDLEDYNIRYEIIFQFKHLNVENKNNL